MKKDKKIDRIKKDIEKTEKIINKLQIPIGAMFNMPHFEMNGNREVIIEGCKGILEYDENIIKINTGKIISQFIGRNLSIKGLGPNDLIVTGFITSIEFIT